MKLNQIWNRNNGRSDDNNIIRRNYNNNNKNNNNHSLIRSQLYLNNNNESTHNSSNITSNMNTFFSQRRLNNGSSNLFPMPATIHNFSANFNHYIAMLVKEDKLFHHSLKKSLSSSLLDYFNDFSFSNNAKVIFIQSPSFCGINHIINEIKAKHAHIIYRPVLNQRDLFSNLQEVLTYELKHANLSSANKKLFFIVENFPIEIVNMAISNTNKNNLYQQWVSQFKSFTQLILSYLNNSTTHNSKLTHQHTTILFWWEDNSFDTYIIDKLFRKEIINHPQTLLITIKPITCNKVKSIIKDILAYYSLSKTESVLDSIYSITKHNLLQLHNYLLFYIKSSTHSKPSTLPTFALNEQERDLFHLLGRLLYNKRIDKRTFKIRGMTKQEMLSKPTPELYFTISDILNACPISKEEFNHLLIENAFNHYKVIDELALLLDANSFCEGLNKFEYKLKERNYPVDNTIESLKYVLNAQAVISFNLSQYSVGNKHSFGQFTKSIYNYKVEFDKSVYEKVIESHKEVAVMSKQTYLKEVLPFYVALNSKEHKYNNKKYVNNLLAEYSNGNELSDYELNRMKCESKCNVNIVDDIKLRNLERNIIMNKLHNKQSENHLFKEKGKHIKTYRDKREEEREYVENVASLLYDDDDEEGGGGDSNNEDNSLYSDVDSEE